MGAKHGHQAGFAYSEVLLGKAGPWTFEAMNEWLKSPKAYAPGTKMSFAGLSKPEDRANLMVYLNAQGSNLPLPAAPAAAAPATDAATDGAVTPEATAGNSADQASNAVAASTK